MSNAEIEFADFAKSLGFDIGNPQPERITRFDIGKKKKLGWYILHTDAPRPYGIIANHAEGGVKHTWQMGGEFERLSPEEYKRRRAEQKASERERLQLEAETRRAAQIKARAAWEKAVPAVSHEYLTKKGIKPHNTRIYGGDKLAVPMFDQRGDLVSFQAIFADSKKLFFKDAGKKGYFNYIGVDFRTAKRILVCEGFATGATIAEAINDAAVIIAFDAGNLEPVARFFSQIRPDATITICGDNDRFSATNIGQIKAEHVSSLLKCEMVIPLFDADTGTDFNDLAAQKGHDEVRRQILGLPVKSNVVDIATKKPSEKDKKGKEEWFYIPGNDNQPAKKLIYNFRGFLTHMNGAEFRYNCLKEREEIKSPSWDKKSDWREINETDLYHAREWLQLKGMQPTKSEIESVMEAIASDTPYDPIVDYLNNLEWDGTDRLRLLFPDYFDSSPSEWTDIIGPKFMISAVARAFVPGCKVDTMVILEGEQGTNKSSAIAALFGKDYTNDSTDLFDSEAKLVEATSGKWAIEVAEFAAITKSRYRDKITALLTKTSEKTRLAFKRRDREYKRKFVLIGTINPTDNGYLTDTTGNRRYWPVKVNEINLQAIKDDRDQLWAEAVHRYKLGESWWLTQQESEIAKVETSQRDEIHPFQERLQNTIHVDRVTINECFELLNLPPAERQIGQARVIAACLKRIGYISKQESVRGARERYWTLG